MLQAGIAGSASAGNKKSSYLHERSILGIRSSAVSRISGMATVGMHLKNKNISFVHFLSLCLFA